MSKQKYWDGTQWVEMGASANKVKITDSESLIDATDVEGALEEIVTDFNIHLAETMTQMYTVTTGFAEGWSGTICYGKTNADILIVSIDTLTKTSDIGSNDTVYTLPAGYRPAIFAKTNAAGINAGVAVVNGSMVEIIILTTGALRLRNVGGVTATVVSAQGVIIICPM